MTYDLSDEQAVRRDAARALVQEQLSTAAGSIDTAGAIPGDMLQAAQRIVSASSADQTSLVVVVEELAVGSAAVAAAAALDQKVTGSARDDATGLRGFAASASSGPRSQLVFAATALGIGRAAVEFALDVLRQAARTSQDQEKPHWAVADAATEVQAARLLTLRAAADDSEAEAGGVIAMAKLAATRAALQAVETALRIAGPDAFTRGAVLERLTRDARAVSLMMGTEEELRSLAASAVLPG